MIISFHKKNVIYQNEEIFLFSDKSKANENKYKDIDKKFQERC